MTLTNEDLQAIANLIQPLKEDIQGLREEVQKLKDEVEELKQRMTKLEARMTKLEARTTKLETRMTGLELHVENNTDKNIRLIAENFVELTNKLNQAIPAAEKNLAYEVKVNYLIEEVDNLKKMFQDAKIR